MINLDDRFITDLMPTVKPNGVAVLLAIAKHCNMRKEAFPSNQRLCKLTSLSTNTVKKTIKDLKAKNLLKAKERWNDHGRNKSNLYYINTDLIGIYIPAKSVEFEGSEFDDLGGQILTPEGSKFDDLGGQNLTGRGQNLTIGGSKFDPEVLTRESIKQGSIKQQQQITDVDNFLPQLILDKKFLSTTSKAKGVGEEIIKSLAADFFYYKKSIDELSHRDYAEFRKNFRFWLNKQDLEKAKSKVEKNTVVDYAEFNEGKSGVVKVGDLGEVFPFAKMPALDFDTADGAKKMFWYFLTESGKRPFSVTAKNKILLRLFSEYFAGVQNELNPNYGFCLFGSKEIDKEVLLDACQKFTKKTNSQIFKTARCTKIVEALGEAKKESSLAKYYTGDWCFTEIGEEPATYKLFSNPIAVMKKILLERKRGHFKTYMTTSLTPPQFRERYGDEVFNWLSGNMNFLVYQK